MVRGVIRGYEGIRDEIISDKGVKSDVSVDVTPGFICRKVGIERTEDDHG